MSYTSTVSALLALGHELQGTPRKFELAHMRVLAGALGDPQKRFKSVLIAGTNGKGSASATLASILSASGHKTGLYTSPHLVRVNERIQVNGAAISDDAFAAAYARVDAMAKLLVGEGKLPHYPSFFEVLTAMAFLHFAEKEEKVDIAVLEVGLGGRLDATNIVEPLISVIADISLDHQQWLGNSIGEIAREKAGIIREGGTVITLPQHPEANDVIGNVCLDRHARAIAATEYVPNVSPSAVRLKADQDLSSRAERGTPIDPDAARRFSKEVERVGKPASYDNLRIPGHQLAHFLRTRYFLEIMGEEVMIETPLIGRHQLRNVALAVATAVELEKLGFATTPAQIAEGIRETRWPGRFQFLPADPGSPDPDFLLDVAHNPAGAWALRNALSEQFEDRKVTLVFGGMRDKALNEMAEILFPLAECVILTHADSPRAATTGELREICAQAIAPLSPTDVLAADTVADALTIARRQTPHTGLVVVTGSIYIVGATLAQLQG